MRALCVCAFAERNVKIEHTLAHFTRDSLKYDGIVTFVSLLFRCGRHSACGTGLDGCE